MRKRDSFCILDIEIEFQMVFLSNLRSINFIQDFLYKGLTRIKVAKNKARLMQKQCRRRLIKGCFGIKSWLSSIV